MYCLLYVLESVVTRNLDKPIINTIIKFHYQYVLMNINNMPLRQEVCAWIERARHHLLPTLLSLPYLRPHWLGFINAAQTIQLHLNLHRIKFHTSMPWLHMNNLMNFTGMGLETTVQEIYLFPTHNWHFKVMIKFTPFFKIVVVKLKASSPVHANC